MAVAPVTLRAHGRSSGQMGGWMTAKRSAMFLQNSKTKKHMHAHVVAAFSIFCVAEMSRSAAVMQSPSELLLVNVDPLD